MRYRRSLGILFLVLAVSLPVSAQELNGFDLSNTAIPADQIQSGGPPRDGIPALTNPSFERLDQQSLSERKLAQPILGVAIAGEARAYPIAILNYHELVNDQVGKQPVLISFGPLCGTGMVFSRKVAGKVLTFGVSGLLYNNNLLMYDRETQSLWSQASGMAVSGKYKGTKLTWLAVSQMPLAEWKVLYPSSSVLNEETGYSRNYAFTPYPGYNNSSKLYFPLSHQDQRYPRKEWVIAVNINGRTKAYPYSELRRAKLPVKDEVGGVALVVDYDPEHNYATLKAVSGEAVPVIYSFWFSWVATFPDTEVYTAGPQQ